MREPASVFSSLRVPEGIESCAIAPPCSRSTRITPSSKGLHGFFLLRSSIYARKARSPRGAGDLPFAADYPVPR